MHLVHCGLKVPANDPARYLKKHVIFTVENAKK